MEEQRKSKFEVWAPIIISCLTMIGSVIGWSYTVHMDSVKVAQEKRRENKKHLESLLRIQQLLEDTKELQKHLKEQYGEKGGWGILESYVLKIRQGSGSKKAIDENKPMLAELRPLIAKDEEIMRTLDEYLRCASPLDKDFDTEARNFRNHANNYLGQWNMLEDFARIRGLKEQLPWIPPFPKRFPEALAREIVQRRAIVNENNH